MKNEKLYYEHEQIGMVEVIEAVEIEREFDSARVLAIIDVESDACNYDIEQALLDHYTDADWCGHDFDCCGCWSHRAWFATKMPTYADENLWAVHISSSSNV
jgi:hypothetical protein